jgi:hypothetical protein
MAGSVQRGMRTVSKCVHLGENLERREQRLLGLPLYRTYRECGKGHGPQCGCEKRCGPSCPDHQLPENEQDS